MTATPSPQIERRDPDLTHAIHAAYLRLLEHYPSDHGGHEAIFGLAGDIATDAVEAAAPILIRQAEDRVHLLEVEVRDLMHRLQAVTDQQAGRP